MKYNEKEVKKLRSIYKPGTKIRLIHMDDPYPVADGSIGIVDHVDDAGQIHMDWNNSSLALVPGVDEFEIITDGE